MPAYRYLVWNCGKAKSTVLEAQDTPAAISAAESWARGQSWGPLGVIRLHVAKMNHDGNIMCVELVHVGLGPETTEEECVPESKPDLAHIITEGLARILRGIRAYEEDRCARGYVGQLRVYEVEDDRFQRFIIAGSEEEALGLARRQMSFGEARCRVVPWDEEVDVRWSPYNSVTRTAREWAHCEPIGILYWKSLDPKETKNA